MLLSIAVSGKPLDLSTRRTQRPRDQVANPPDFSNMLSKHSEIGNLYSGNTAMFTAVIDGRCKIQNTFGHNPRWNYKSTEGMMAAERVFNFSLLARST